MDAQILNVRTPAIINQHNPMNIRDPELEKSNSHSSNVILKTPTNFTFQHVQGIVANDRMQSIISQSIVTQFGQGQTIAETKNRQITSSMGILISATIRYIFEPLEINAKVNC